MTWSPRSATSQARTTSSRLASSRSRPAPGNSSSRSSSVSGSSAANTRASRIAFSRSGPGVGTFFSDIGVGLPSRPSFVVLREDDHDVGLMMALVRAGHPEPQDFQKRQEGQDTGEPVLEASEERSEREAPRPGQGVDEPGDPLHQADPLARDPALLGLLAEALEDLLERLDEGIEIGLDPLLPRELLDRLRGPGVDQL